MWSAMRVMVARFCSINCLTRMSSRRDPSRFEMISTMNPPRFVGPVFVMTGKAGVFLRGGAYSNCLGSASNH
ncbi:hypothetical protein MesoLjLb_25110 [Mesorhizobium sp. L-8-3]|nr:hypothetical protein MesoLjLb_25110 [Mesorhizobium sp. L-8-3]